MKNLVTEKDINCFMQLQKPTKAAGFFSEGYSGNKPEFVEGLEGSMSGLYTGAMTVLAKTEALKLFDHMNKKLEQEEEDQLSQSEIEVMVCFWEQKNGKALVLCAEFGSSDQMCSEMVNQVEGKESVVLFDEASLTVEDMKAVGVELTEDLTSALTELKKQ